MFPRSANAAGPWHGKVIDAETGKPLEGVVVLATWWRYTASVGGWSNKKYYDSEEVITDADGRFAIRSRWINRFWYLLLTEIRGPRLYIFKPGYGRWRFQGEEGWKKLNNDERVMRLDEAWEELERGSVVIELPPLKTEDRLEALDLGPYGEVPDSRMLRYLEALDQERALRSRPPLPRHEK